MTFCLIFAEDVQLGYMKDEDCPDELVDMTIARLKLATIKEPLPHNNGSQFKESEQLKEYYCALQYKNS
jgi:hypothetical protein